jgi:16S rRNA (cytidine1402-2'-O)-methyltransferase
VVARELTKLHEELVRGTLSEVARHFGVSGVRGEITLAIEGGAAPTRELDVATRAATLAAEGNSLAETAAKLAVETGLRRREAYRLLLGLRNCVKM